jgi:F-type H+-transporting ATPase subunit gamma
MASLKVLRRRIRSVTSTQQITKAMEMVAAAKLRRAQARALATRPYALKLTEMLENLAAAARERELPLFAAREVKTTVLVVITSDRGLCGGYNTNLFRATEERLRGAAAPAGHPPPSGHPPQAGRSVGSLALIVVGRKGRDYFKRRGWPVLATFTDLGADASVEAARRVTSDLLRRFESREVDKVEILYTRFFSALRRQVTCETFLPIGAEPSAEHPAAAGDVLFEPGLETIFEALLPRFASARMLAALADARASEEGARMTAMGAATKNAGELLDALVLQRNRLRQLMITREILDIVGGAEALR